MLYNTNGIDSCNGTIFRIRWKINILFYSPRWIGHQSFTFCEISYHCTICHSPLILYYCSVPLLRHNSTVTGVFHETCHHWQFVIHWLWPWQQSVTVLHSQSKSRMSLYLSVMTSFMKSPPPPPGCVKFTKEARITIARQSKISGMAQHSIVIHCDATMATISDDSRTVRGN